MIDCEPVYTCKQPIGYPAICFISVSGTWRSGGLGAAGMCPSTTPQCNVENRESTPIRCCSVRVYGVENLTGQFREKDARCALDIFSLNVDYFFLRISVQKHKENIELRDIILFYIF